MSLRSMRGGFSPSCSESTCGRVSSLHELLELLPGMVTCQTRTGWRKQATDSSMYARNFWKQPNQRAFSLAL